MSIRPLLPLALLLLPGVAAPQTSRLVAEAGASRFLPPLGVEGPAANYLLAGLRGEFISLGGSGITLSVLGGRATDASIGGSFVSGEAAALLRHRLSRAWEMGGEARLSGFTVGDPFPYEAGAVEGETWLRWGSDHLSATMAGTAGWGRSRVELSRYTDGPVRTVVDDLWRYGGTAELLAGSRTLAAGVSAGYHESAGGHFRSLGGRVVVGIGGGAVELRADVWDTPTGNETTGGLALAIPFGAWSMRGFLGRSEPDPLTLAEPGRGGGGALLGFRVAGRDGVGGFPPRSTVHQVVDSGEGDARIRFAIQAPEAGTVALLGDFTLWQPLAMTRNGGEWVLEVAVPAGTHHYGFTMDGEWYLPDDAPDAFTDEWGRRSATLVVEG